MTDKSILEGKKRIHFIGIGGSGMFPLAQILHQKGFSLTGSDNNETETLDLVRKMGIPVFMGQRAENIEGAELIVHTSAIMADNPELIAARASGVPVLERKDLLGLVTTWYDNAICVCGTHGKTTTTSMIATILHEYGDDFGCVIGGKLPIIGGSGRVGSSGTMVCEADEFVDTFLKLSPDTAVVLNIDEDHMEYFKTLENLENSFAKFASSATRCVIYNVGDKNAADAMARADIKERITFSKGSEGDYYPVVTSSSGLVTKFDIYYKGEKQVGTEIHVPGRHNVLNAVAAFAAARSAGVPVDVAARGIAKFRGALRRFEKIAEVNGVTICDDYAHHPAEIAATLGAAKELDFKRIIAVHQPFTYSRTFRLMKDFAAALSNADEVVLTEIMGSREKNTYGVSSKDLAEITPNCTLTPTFSECVEFLKKEVRAGDLVITLGCGDIYKVAKQLAKELEV